MSETPAKPDPALKGKMLPGVAGISMFLMFLTLLNVYAALTGIFGPGAGKYGVLALCTILVAGLFGLLRMKRWGLAIVLDGCLMLCGGNAYAFRMSQSPAYVIQALFMLVFFLYLVRTEVRDRML
jgi:glyoxylate carboligase